MKILIVEDDADVRESLDELLQQHGFQVETAVNGADALTKLQGELPCAVILDLLMPVMDGNELYARMQSDARFRHVPIVISTSDPSRAPEGSVIVRKPIQFERLLKMLQSFCGGAA